MKNELSRNGLVAHAQSAAIDPRMITDEALASPVVMEQGRKRGIGTTIHRIALVLVGALCVALTSAAAPADAAAKNPFEAHGAFASCGKGENRATVYITFLSLRSERGFDDVNALLRHAAEIRPERTKIRLPGQNRARKLGSIGASLPDFLFIDYLETKRGPGAAAHERATISWRSERSETRQRSSLRLNDLGKGFCEQGAEDKVAVNERKLRGQALEVEDRGERGRSAAPPRAFQGSDSRHADPRSSGQCANGAYYGRAEDGTEFSFVLKDSRVSDIQARAGSGDLRYEVNLPETTVTTNPSSANYGMFWAERKATETGLGESSAARMVGRCVAGVDVRGDFFDVGLRDRAGNRATIARRNVLEPGVYEGSVQTTQGWYTHGSMRFLIHPDGSIDDPLIGGVPPTHGGREPATGNVSVPGEKWWTGERLGNRGYTFLRADRCQMGFHLYRLERGKVFPKALITDATCKPGNRIDGTLRLKGVNWNDSWAALWAEKDDLVWEAHRVAPYPAR